MTTWSKGYVTDIEYTNGFFYELSPRYLCHILLSKGIESPDITQPYTYCELGCGQGVTTNVLAAANPLGEFYATDFNPSHIVNANSLARDAQLSNVHFFDASFDEFLKEEGLPQFDFIVLHGILSWVALEVRQHIVDFLAKKLKVGGVVYLSYNTLPGCASHLGLRELIYQCSQQASGSRLQQIDQTLNFLKTIAGQNAAYFLQNPTSQQRLDQLDSQNRNYLVHEYLHDSWHLYFHSEVARILAEAKLSFVVSAQAADNLDLFRFTPEQIQTLREVSDPILAETLRDTYLNTMFRKDVFVHGVRKLSGLEQRERFIQTQAFSLITSLESLPSEFSARRMTISTEAEPISTILRLLSQRPHYFHEFCTALPHVALEVIYQTILALLDQFWIYPSLATDEFNQNHSSTERFNRVITRRATKEPGLQTLASPLLQSGLTLNQPSLLFLEARYLGQSPPDFALHCLQQQGFSPSNFGHGTEVEWLTALSAQWQSYQQHSVPMLQCLRIIA